MKVGFLGLGNMGTPMALRLLVAGHELSVWNRSEERTKPLVREGAIAAATPAEAETCSHGCTRKWPIAPQAAQATSLFNTLMRCAAFGIDKRSQTEDDELARELFGCEVAKSVSVTVK